MENSTGPRTDYRTDYNIRHSTEADLPAMLDIYAAARHFMRQAGNPTQWGDSYPTPEQLLADMAQGVSYVCTDGGGRIVCTFVYYQGQDPDPNYKTISGGAWPDNLPYGVVHRIASARDAQGPESRGTAGGAATHCIMWCYEQSGHHLRIDTHADNRPMQRLVRKLGFEYCGVVVMTNGDGTLRDAFQKN